MDSKTGKLGNEGEYLVEIDEIEDYLPRGYTVEQADVGSPWYGYYKIIRPDGTHFWASTWEDIDRMIHFGV